MTAALNVTVDLRNASGSSSVLAFDETSAVYTIVQAQPGDLTRRRDVSTSPFIPGEYEVTSVPAAGTFVLEVLVTGASWSAMDTARNALITAASARRWVLRVTTNGVVENYTCYAAEHSSPVEVGWSWARKRRLVLTIPLATPVPA